MAYTPYEEHHLTCELKSAKLRLTQNELNFRNFFHSLDDCIFVLNKDFQIIETNQAVTNKMGYSKDELYGKLFQTLCPENFTLAPKTETLILTLKNGQKVPYEIYPHQTQWDNNSVLFYICRDISKLKISEEKFANAFNNSPALMAISTLDEGRFIDVNTQFSEVLGYDRNDLIGRTSLEIMMYVDPLQRNYIKEKALSEGHVRHLIVPYRTKSGKIRQACFSADVINIWQKKHLIVVMIDTTEEKLTSEALSLEKERYHSLVETISDWVWEIDPNGKFVYSNPASLTILNKLPESLIGSNIHDLIIKADNEEHISFLQEITHQRHTFETKSGEKRTLESSVTPILSSQGKILGHRGISRDVTKQQNHYLDLKKQSLALQKEIEDRTQEITQKNEQLSLLINEKQRYIDQVEQHNITLRKILETIEDQKNEVYMKVNNQLDGTIYPLLMQLKSNPENPKRIVDIIIKQLKNFKGKEQKTLISTKYNLTPAEIQVATLLKEGLSSKQLALELRLSIHTINNHTKHIRKKLKLTRGTNLKSTLRNFTL